MNYKEKAIELRNKFRHFRGIYIDSDGNEQNTYLASKHVAKLSAIMAIDETILYHPISTEPNEQEIKFHDYWQKVRHELTKL